MDRVTLNFSKMLRNLAQPRENLRLLKQGKIKEVKGRRVHYLPIILEYGCNGSKSYRCYNLVISGKGIHRIEKIPLPNEV